ncbi:MAG: hypothetical protein WCP52_02120 [Bacteroidota bacterium]
MKKQKVVYEYKVKTIDYLKALAQYPNFLKLINIEDKPYKEIIEWVLQKETSLQDDSFVTPSVKTLSEEIGMDYAKVTKYLKYIYFEIIDLNNKHPELFVRQGQMKCYFGFKYFESSHTFILGMDYLPRIEEHFTFNFINPILGNSSFYVQQVWHDYEHSGHSVIFTMVPRLPYKYMALLKEKAYLNRDISFHEFYDFERNSELEEKLLKLYKTL